MSSPRPDCEFQGQPVSPIRMHMYLDLFPQFSAASDSRATHSGLKKIWRTNEIQGLDAHCCCFVLKGGKRAFKFFLMELWLQSMEQFFFLKTLRFNLQNISIFRPLWTQSNIEKNSKKPFELQQYNCIRRVLGVQLHSGHSWSFLGNCSK